MKKICLFILFTTFTLLFAQKACWRALNPSKHQIKYLVENGFDIASAKPNSYIDVVINNAQKLKLASLGYNLSLQFTQKQLKANLAKNTRLDGYHTYYSLKQELTQLQTRYPNVMKICDIGDSWGKINNINNIYGNFNHDILAVKVSNDVNTEDNAKPAVFFVGGIHAREPISVEVCLAVLTEIVTNYQTDAEIANWLQNRQLWFVPLINPDGHKIVLDELDLMWRKNIKDNNNNGIIDFDNNSGFGDDGVDLNRNFGYKFGLLGSSGDINSCLYHGTEAFSEPETQALKQFFKSINFVTGISYHSYGEQVLYPWANMDNIVTQDNTAIEQLATKMANSIQGINVARYMPIIASGLYPTSGGLDDWVYANTGAFCYTIELATQFIPPANQIPIICQNNIPAAKILIKSTMQSALNITVNSGVSQLIVNGVDNTGNLQRKVTTFGNSGKFLKILTPGTYNIKVKSLGYEDKNINNVVVNSNSLTNINVSLQQARTYNFNLVSNVAYYSLNKVTFVDLPNKPVYYSDEENHYLHVENMYKGIHKILVNTNDIPSFYARIRVDDVLIEQQELIQIDTFFDNYYFRNGIEEEWQTGNDWYIVNENDNNYLTESPNGNYNNNMIYELSRSFSAFSNDNCFNGCTTLSFDCKYDLEENFDYAMVMASSNGVNWERIDEFTGQSNGWQAYYYDFTRFAENNYVWFKIKMITDGQNTADGICLDNFKIAKTDSYTASNDVTQKPFDYNAKSYPNPFNPLTNISFNLPSPQKVSVEVYNVKGQKVKTIFKGLAKQKVNSFTWKGKNDYNKNVGSGVYFYKVKTKNKTIVNKMLLLK